LIHNKHLARPIDIEEDIETMAIAQADVLAGLKEIVEEVAGIPAASVELDKNFTDDLDVDSLSMVEVVVAAEERFGVKIPDENVTDLLTVADAVNFIVNASK
jgi:acyl carrier protein